MHAPVCICCRDPNFGSHEQVFMRHVGHDGDFAIYQCPACCHETRVLRR